MITVAIVEFFFYSMQQTTNMLNGVEHHMVIEIIHLVACDSMIYDKVAFKDKRTIVGT